ncbi:G-type lectin S-receptor serine/threonine-protein kinase [Spatholobus suberectus]|nr:G-type lectin S-receptor serine/threonine-protein kinase [Spatholobus suberectus]
MRTDQVLFFSFLSWTLCSQLCSAGDTLNAGEKITQDSAGNLVSSNLTFELGFFPLPTESGNSSEKDTWGYEDGNLVVEGASGSHWSSELEGSSSFTNRTVKLLDSGNLVLMDDNLGASYLWQSFQNPTDTFLPGMKMDPSLTLTSWKDATDPARGSFTFKLDQGAEGRRFVVQNQSQIYWALDELDTEAMYPVIVGLLDNATRGIISDKRNGTIYPSRSYSYNKSRLLMNASGEIQFLKWMEEDSRWDKQWSGPGDKCDRQDYCGSFGICNKNNQIRCKCLPGFSPRNSQYPAEIQGQGCVRKSKSCIDKDNVMFLNFTRIKVGDPDGEFVRIETEAECQSLCLNGNKCPESLCQAYSYSTSTYDRGSIITCKIWTRNLSNLIEEYDRGLDLSILVKRSDLAPTAKTCEPCGTYVIPYPLSTGPNCGDPMYNRFNCSNSTGHLSFTMPEENSYPVTIIDEDTRMFYIETDGSFSCSSSPKYQNDTPNFPFVVADCTPGVGIIKIKWLPAQEPPCSKLIDCKNLPHSTCAASEGGSRCLCDSKYKWNDSTMSCAQEEPSRHRSTNRLALILTVILTGIAILAVAGIIAFVIVRKKKTAHRLDGASTRIQESLYESERQVKDMLGLGSLEEKDIEGIEVPCYTFASILAATDNFSDSNKLGRGGYGPVYKMERAAEVGEALQMASIRDTKAPATTVIRTQPTLHSYSIDEQEYAP